MGKHLLQKMDLFHPFYSLIPAIPKVAGRLARLLQILKAMQNRPCDSPPKGKL